MTLNRSSIAAIFQEGEIVPSGAGARQNAAELEILGLEEDGIRFKPKRAKLPVVHQYKHLQVLLDSFIEMDGRSIQKSVNQVWNRAGIPWNDQTENYAYTLVKAIHERENSRD